MLWSPRLFVMALVFLSAVCWLFPSNRLVTRSPFCGRIWAPDTEDDEVWGQSFIGQDVCGSKLNDDPFDGARTAQSAWEKMKRKIEALERADMDGNQNKTLSEARKK